MRWLRSMVTAGRPLHLHISLIFGSLFLILALTLVSFAYVAGRATALSQASTLVDARLDNLISHSVGQLAEIEAVVAALANTSRLTIAGRGDPTGKFAVLKDSLSHLPLVDGMYVGYPNGEFAHLVELDDNAWRRALTAPNSAKYAFRTISIAPNGSRTSLWEFFDEKGTFVSGGASTEAEFDPRTRPWFRLAKANAGLAWTPAYVFATTRQIGFTISSIMRDLPGAVVAADITLEHLGEMFEQQKITPGTRVLLFDDHGNLLASSGMAKLAAVHSGGAGEPTVDQKLEFDPLMQEIYRRSVEGGWSSDESFSFDIAGRSYLATVKAIQPTPNQRVFMAMATPIEELTAGVTRTNMKALAISLILALLSLPIVAFAARRLARPLNRLSAEAGKIERFELDQSIPIRSRIAEVRELEEAMNAAKMGLRTFGRYVPVDLVRQILRSGVSPSVGGERRELTVMFSDIRAFTGIAESLAPEELIGLLSEYFQLASDAILGSGGTIDKFIGDGVLALWNAPQRVENHEAQACRCALEMQRKIGIFNEQQRSRTKPTLETRIGIHTGVAVVGNVGTAARLEYTALGDIVNIAARLEQINKTYETEIIVSGAVEKAVGEAFIFRHLGEVSLKGRRRPVRILELSGEVPNPLRRSTQKT